MSTLTDQIIDLVLREWRDKGVKPVQLYDAIGRVWPDDKASKLELDVARGQYQNDDCEIDDNALTSKNDDGVWVAAWVWVCNFDLGVEEVDDERGQANS
jgi:hypothetical protein